MKRNVAISYVRMIAMIFIVVCHVFQYYNNQLAWWFNVGVQMFLMISGYLYGLRDIDDAIDFYKKQYVKILIPFWVYLIPTTIVFYFVDKKVLSIVSMLKAFLGAAPYKGLEHLWFIPYILFCYLVTPVLNVWKHHARKKELKQICVEIIFGLVFLEIASRAYEFYFRASRVACYVIGYTLAVIKQKAYRDNYRLKLSLVSVTILGFLVNIVRALVKYTIGSRLSGPMLSIFSVFEEYSHVWLGLSLFLAFLYLLYGLQENWLTRISDRFSYYVYLTHHLFILSSISVLSLNCSWIIKYSILLGAIVLSTVLLEFISRRVNQLVKKLL